MKHLLIHFEMFKRVWYFPMIVEVNYIIWSRKCFPKRRLDVLFNRIKEVCQKIEYILTPSLDSEMHILKQIPIRVESSSIQAL